MNYIISKLYCIYFLAPFPINVLKVYLLSCGVSPPYFLHVHSIDRHLIFSSLEILLPFLFDYSCVCFDL